MNVGIYLLDTKTLDSQCGYACAKALTQSVRRHMPGVPVVHLTDDRSPAIEGVDQVRRKPRERMARLRMRHHSDVQGDWLFLDTDVLIQQDVRSVFNRAFQIGVTVRDWDHLKPATGFTQRMPFNMGVVFSRSQTFWAEAYARVRELPKPEQQWMGDQQVFCDLLEEGRYAVRRLSGSRYNFPPAIEPDDDEPGETGGNDVLLEQAAIVHYKGPQRKLLMLARIEREALTCV